MDYAEITARADAIAQQAVLVPDPARVEAAMAQLQVRTATSGALHQRYQGLVARGSQHTLPLAKPWPLFIRTGQGAWLEDVDGNRWLDYILSGGAVLLGHNPPEVNERMAALLAERTHFHGHFDELELAAAAKLVEHVPGIEKVRFTASGTEADQAAIRLARAWTRRSKIVKYKGGYHGWGDTFMTDMEIPGSERFIAMGVPGETLDLTLLCGHSLDELCALFKAHEGQIAAVIAEPLGGESGLVPFPEGFHAEAMAIAHQHGALYIFDEVVSGLRCGLSGAQGMLGVTPDLTTMGKALMSGYAGCGVVGGRAELVDTLSTGLPLDGRPYAYLAGTMSGNPVSSLAALATLEALEAPGVEAHLFAVAADLTTKLGDLFESKALPFFAYNYGGVIRVELTAPHAVPLDDPRAMREVIQRRAILADYAVILQSQGVLSRMGRDMISVAHTPEDNDIAVAAWAALCDSMVR